jgi:hypothetical protein
VQYEVRIVQDGELPDGCDAVIVERADSVALMLLSGRPAEVWASMRRWEDSHHQSGCEQLAAPTVLLFAV